MFTINGKIKVILLLFAFALLAGCDGHGMGNSGGMMGSMAGSMMNNANISSTPPVTETDKRYTQGFQKAEKVCSQCHALPNPNLHTAEEWPGVIARMKVNMKNFHKTVPSATDLQSITAYYQANAK